MLVNGLHTQMSHQLLEVTRLKHTCPPCRGMSILWPPGLGNSKSFQGKVVLGNSCRCRAYYFPCAMASYVAIKAHGECAGVSHGTKQECVLWWGVNYSGKRCLCGHPGHSPAGLALRGSGQHHHSHASAVCGARDLRVHERCGGYTQLVSDSQSPLQQ